MRISALVGFSSLVFAIAFFAPNIVPFGTGGQAIAKVACGGIDDKGKWLGDCQNKPAKYLGKYTCKLGGPPSAFWDRYDGGACWSCPADTKRSARHVAGKKACRSGSGGSKKWYSAKKIGPKCAPGAFQDPRNGGECWKCPQGYSRRWNKVTSAGACGNNSMAWKPDPFPGPDKLSRAYWKQGTAGTFELLDAEARSLSRFKVYKKNPGLMGLKGGEALALRLLGNPREVTTLLRVMAYSAESNPKKRTVWVQKAWKDILAKGPSKSPYFLGMMPSLLTGALKSLGDRKAPNAERDTSFAFIKAMEDYIRQRRIYIAMDATRHYLAFEATEAYKRANDRSLQNAGMMKMIDYGTVPPDFLKYATESMMPGTQAAAGMVLAGSVTLGGLSAYTMITGNMPVLNFTNPMAKAVLKAAAETAEYNKAYEIAATSLEDTAKGLSKLADKGDEIAKTATSVINKASKFKNLAGTMEGLATTSKIASAASKALAAAGPTIIISIAMEIAQTSIKNIVKIDRAKSMVEAALKAAPERVNLLTMTDYGKAIPLPVMLQLALATSPDTTGYVRPSPKLIAAAKAAYEQERLDGQINMGEPKTVQAARRALEEAELARLEPLARRLRNEGREPPLAINLGWKKLDGTARDVAVALDGTAWIIGITRQKVGGFDIYRRGPKERKWTRVQGAAERIAVFGNRAWVVTKEGTIFKRNNFDTGWQKVDAPKARDIGASVKGVAIVGADGKIYQYELGGTWKHLPGSATQIAVDSWGAIWVVNKSNQIFWWNNTKWQRWQGQGTDIAAFNTNEPVVVGTDGNVWGYSKEARQWVNSGRKAKAVTLAPNGEAWLAADNRAIWKQDAKKIRATEDPLRRIARKAIKQAQSYRANIYTGLRQVPGKASDIAIAVDGTVWEAGLAGTLYKATPGGKKWTNMKRLAVMRVAVEGNRPWYVGYGGKVYRLNSNGRTWDNMKSAPMAKDVGANIANSPIPGNVFILGFDNRVYRHEGTDKWREYPGAARLKPIRIAVDTAGDPWLLANPVGPAKLAARDVYGWNADRSRWEKFNTRGDAGLIYDIAISRRLGILRGELVMATSKGAAVVQDNQLKINSKIKVMGASAAPRGPYWYIGTDRNLYTTDTKFKVAADKKVAAGGTAPIWQEVPGGGRARDIAVASDGTAWVISMAKTAGGYEIYKRGPKSNRWTKIPGGATRIAIAGSRVFVINNSGMVFQREGNKWTVRGKPGAKDIGASNAAIYIVGGKKVRGGYEVMQWKGGSSWKKYSGGGVRVDVDSEGRPWILNEGGKIFALIKGKWQKFSGEGKDIGIYAFGAPVVVGTDDQLWTFNKNTNKWTPTKRKGIAVAVAPNGKPWYLGAKNKIYKQK